MKLYNYINNLINTRLIAYCGGIILYRMYVMDNTIKMDIKLLYPLNLTQWVVSREDYELTDKITFKSLISNYKELINELKKMTK